jgi:Family of unknown function (DUF695)
MLPKPRYALVNTSIGSDPAVVVVNAACQHFEGCHLFSWHLRVVIDCKFVGSNGMPTDQEINILNRVESIISNSLDDGKNTIFLARSTFRGVRNLIYRLQNPSEANEALQALISGKSQLREWEYDIMEDPDWTLAQPELQLLEGNPDLD